MIRVLIWNEFYHERTEDAVKAVYPDGIHKAIADFLGCEDISVECATLDDESCGIMKSDVRVHRMIVPKELLDKERKYVICARKIIERKPYYTQTKEIVDFF